FRSDDAGQSWQALPTAPLATMPGSTIEIAGISHTDPDLVFALVRLEDNASSDALYRSRDAGATWTRILGEGSSIAFLVRRSGELVAATQALGAVRSIDNGATWTALASAPHANCLVENSAGEVWACTQNYGAKQIPSDGFGIMKSTDLVTWTGVLRYQQLQAPIACGDGTVQRDRCDVQLWCGLCAQLGCASSHPECGGAVDPPPDADSGSGPGPDHTGCCRVSAPAPGALVLVLAVGVLLLLPRRRPRG